MSWVQNRTPGRTAASRLALPLPRVHRAATRNREATHFGSIACIHGRMHSLWFNIGVADLKRATDFYTEIGFEYDSHMPGDMGRVILPDGSFIMLFPHEAIEQFLPVPYENVRTEVLISIGVETREEVAEVIARVEQAGGTVTAAPKEFNGYFGAGFTDPDGHHFNLLVIPKSL